MEMQKRNARNRFTAKKFSNTILSSHDECSMNTFDQVLDYDDQKLFDYIFKNESLGNETREDFINKYLKKFDT